MEGSKSKKIPWHKRIYALYKGDQFVTEGTIPEISEETNKSIDWLQWMTYPTYNNRCADSAKRLRMVPLDDELD